MTGVLVPERVVGDSQHQPEPNHGV